MTPEEAIETYVKAYRDQNPGKYAIQAKVEGNFVRLGYVDLKDNYVQWGMQLHTPDRLVKMAKMLSLGLTPGDPKKPTYH